MKTVLFRTAAILALCAALGAIDQPREKPPRYSARTLGGERLTSEGLRGKAVLVQFWATWCPRCRQDQAAIDTLVREYGDKRLVVIAVDVGEPRKKVEQYLQKYPRACKIVLAEETNLAAVFRAKGVPFYVALAPDGNVAATQLGSGGEYTLRQLLSKAGL
jgi:thiol-disulfide isomerase/thioredoxin